MAYIGRQPVIGNFVKLDAISVVNGQAAYTMQNGGVNFTSYDNVNQFLVSLNGILQSPTDSFTVSGSTLTFASNLSTGDVIDFVMVLGNTLDIGTPSDNTVSLAKLTATGTKDATTFLRGDNTFAEAGGGLVLQVVSAFKTDTFNVTSQTFTDTGLQAQITPSSTSSKILIICSGNGSNSDGGNRTHLRIDGTTTQFVGDAAAGTESSQTISTRSTDDGWQQIPFTISGVDSPASTSQQTYKLQMSASGSTTAYLNRPANTPDSNSGNTMSSIILMEISA